MLVGNFVHGEADTFKRSVISGALMFDHVVQVLEHYY